MTKQRREYESTHQWLTFGVNFKKAGPGFWATLGECVSKCEHIAGVPLRPDVAQQLHSVYLAKGILGTTAIEGNTLSEEEVQRHLEGKLTLSPDKEYLKQEIDNILQESNAMLSRIHEGEVLQLTLERIKDINKIVLKGLSLAPEVVPGKIRHYSVGVMTYRGAPWQDCEYLYTRLCEWLNSDDFRPQSGLSEMQMSVLKAVLGHLYVEWIHGFGDGNGRTGRMLEVQILLSAGVPSPAAHLLSNHYNLTRREYLAQLKHASESGGDVLPFLNYAIQGFLAGLKEQLAYIRNLNMHVSWVNFVHDVFRHQQSKARDRQRMLALDIAHQSNSTSISELGELSPRLAKAYANLHPRAINRDVDYLISVDLVKREGRKIRANLEIMENFLPIRAGRRVS
ncbi:MAG: Fic family protein [Terriglobia bacterium]